MGCQAGVENNINESPKWNSSLLEFSVSDGNSIIVLVVLLAGEIVGADESKKEVVRFLFHKVTWQK